MLLRGCTVLCAAILCTIRVQGIPLETARFNPVTYYGSDARSSGSFLQDLDLSGQLDRISKRAIKFSNIFKRTPQGGPKEIEPQLPLHHTEKARTDYLKFHRGKIEAAAAAPNSNLHPTDYVGRANELKERARALVDADYASRQPTKVWRDNLLVDFHERFPGQSFHQAIWDSNPYAKQMRSYVARAITIHDKVNAPLMKTGEIEMAKLKRARGTLLKEADEAGELHKIQGILAEADWPIWKSM
jgi:hypothetical protein